jgi:DNA topoisomerase-1
VLAQPKKGRQQRGVEAPPLKELGNDPVSGGKVVLKQGRFGPYVTDGETNASLRTGDDPGTITPERAYELLVLRREREAANPSGKKKAAKKKAAPKKAAAAKKAATGDGDQPKKAAAKKPAKKPAKKAAAKKAATKSASKKATQVSASKEQGATGSAAKKSSKKSVESSPEM